MSKRPSVSIVIPSRGRLDFIPQALDALRYLTYPAFEVILVGEYPDLRPYKLPGPIKNAIHYFPCFEANISMARNIGIRAARGEIVAFVDDDAIPEPDWLDRLVEPFANADVGLVGGLVRDRDGLSLQFSGKRFDRMAEESPCPQTTGQAGGEAQIFAPDRERPFGIMGTNCAFRRTAITAIGGFDESYLYYLDETDAALRMNEAGWSTGWVPAAEVHHKSGQNVIRGKHREPKDPFQLAASKAYFCKRHAPEGAADIALQTFVTKCGAEFDRNIRLGRISGDDRTFMERRLSEGFAEGQRRQPTLPLISNNRARVILPFSQRLPNTRLSIALISGMGLQQSMRMKALAHAAATRGHRVTFFVAEGSEPDPSVHFSHGVWEHSGAASNLDLGQRMSELVRAVRGDRSQLEVARVMPRRDFDAVLRPRSIGGLFAGIATWPLRLQDDRAWLTLTLPKTGDEETEAMVARVEAELKAALEDQRFARDGTKAAAPYHRNAQASSG